MTFIRRSKPPLSVSAKVTDPLAQEAEREPPFWRRSLPLDVADRAAQIWVICALLPAWRHAAPMLGRAGELALSSGLCR
jgi:hypothetical protein